MSSRAALSMMPTSLVRDGPNDTEGGEALLVAAQSTSKPAGALARAPITAAARWYALWTHSHCEQRVHDQLLGAGFHAFLPTVDQWSRRRGVQHLKRTPMFPGYLFVHHPMDKMALIEVRKVRGVVQVLGERWDRLIAIPDDEIQAIERVVLAPQRMLPFPYLKEGQRTRITAGPLAGLEGILVEAKPRQGLLVLSVHLLQRSVAVAVDGTAVEPTT
jgi:transcription termination/antitermination protein NusG